MFTYNDPKFKYRRKDLRRNETPEEKLLWLELRGKRKGYKFFRQYSVGPYILDFYCPVLRLGIELDGSQHKYDKEYDEQRDDYLALNDIKVLRFWNSEVSDNIEKVVRTIISEFNLPLGKGRQEGL